MHVNNAINFMLQQHGHLEERVKDNVKQIWDNEEELKGGMDAAEFNLRAHQKVLNAFAIELENLMLHLNDEVFKTEHKLTVLELADVTLPSDAGEGAQVVRRLDWPYYHREVENDLKVIAEHEKEVAEKEQAATEAECDAEAEAVLSEEGGPLPEQGSIPKGATIFGG